MQAQLRGKRSRAKRLLSADSTHRLKIECSVVRTPLMTTQSPLLIFWIISWRANSEYNESGCGTRYRQKLGPLLRKVCIAIGGSQRNRASRPHSVPNHGQCVRELLLLQGLGLEHQSKDVRLDLASVAFADIGVLALQAGVTTSQLVRRSEPSDAERSS